MEHDQDRSSATQNRFAVLEMLEGHAQRFRSTFGPIREHGRARRHRLKARAAVPNARIDSTF